MFRIVIASIGKTKEVWLEKAISEYLKRLQHKASIDFHWFKNDAQLISFVKNEKKVVCLDSQGEIKTSVEFSLELFKQFETNKSRAVFIIGGAEGLPLELKSCYPLLSFSRLTFTHQIVRLILVEQIYRAFEIEKGTAYHK